MLTACIIVTITVLAVLWLNQQDSSWIKTILNWFSAILFAYVIPALVTHATGWDLSKVYLHSISKDWIIPLAILAVMSALSFRQLKMIGFRPIFLFVMGSLVISILPVLLVLLFGVFSEESNTLFIEGEYWKGLAPIVGSWIGGSTSQLVLKELSDCSESLFLSILVLDNIFVNIWTILMFQFIKRTDNMNAYFNIKDKVPDFVPNTVDFGKKTQFSLWLTAGTIVLVAVLSYLLIPSFLYKIIALSFVGLFLGNFSPIWNHSLVLKIGGILIICIMAILGLKLDFSGLSLPFIFIGLVLIWLILHFVFMLGLAILMKLHIAWVPIASMANLGGISTAPAVTAAYNEEWMPHAILLAILSMVSGTAWGMLTIFLFQSLS
ncbi:MAG: DUF819 family protein [Saprospiraceae bacterium]